MVTMTPSAHEATRTTVGFVNLGCSKNQVDSEVMLGALAQKGFTFTSDPRSAEVVIINTCGFIEEAKQESIDAIIRFGELKKSGACKVLIAAGCLSQRYQDELLKSLPELDGVVGTGETGRIADICRVLLTPGRKKQRVWMSPPPYLYDEFTARVRLGRPHSAFVKIAEGCNRKCAFCAIPLMRGKQRSRPPASIVAEIQGLAAEGVTEINLISQDTINYGSDLGLRQGLVTLLRQVVKVPGLRWIRPFYLYPQQVSDDLIALYAGEAKIAKYVDMPLQHINDTMLKRMRRLGTKASMTELVNRFRSRIPGLSFRTGFIVGFPGETKAAFRELKRYLTEMEFDHVGVFLYSDEEGTAGVNLQRKIPREVMEERRADLLAVQEKISLRKNRGRIGQTLEVLVEGPSEETDLLLEARHEGQAPDIDGVVYLNDGNFNFTPPLHPPSLDPPGRALSPLAQARSLDARSRPSGVQIDAPLPVAGDYLKAEITDASSYDLVGRIVG
jgi:ribosomal protein S12 methylthiotransferase